MCVRVITVSRGWKHLISESGEEGVCVCVYFPHLQDIYNHHSKALELEEREREREEERGRERGGREREREAERGRARQRESERGRERQRERGGGTCVVWEEEAGVVLRPLVGR